jgi:hypothetical protein
MQTIQKVKICGEIIPDDELNVCDKVTEGQ